MSFVGHGTSVTSPANETARLIAGPTKLVIPESCQFSSP